MPVNLYEHQKLAVEKLKSGSILCGGVGTGKSLAAITYFYTKVCGGSLPRRNDIVREVSTPVDLYIITTAKKRDSLEWDKELVPFGLSKNERLQDISVYIDSWNNIKKYVGVSNAFFIFDEQRLVGTGQWVKSFWKIAKSNHWVVLTATPGDNWLDYAPIFIANGFYKNITEFRNMHVVYKSFTDFPQVDHYIHTGRLEALRAEIVVPMDYAKEATQHHLWTLVGYDDELYSFAEKNYWNIYEEKPVEQASELCYMLRKIVNNDQRRVQAVRDILANHPRSIVFYNFDYELEMLRKFAEAEQYPYSEWNGHKHQPLLSGPKWLYLVQYTAGAEGWNCITTDTIIFFSQNYSWKIMQQAAGRTDRLNTPYTDLYYYHLFSGAPIDKRIRAATTRKKKFSETNFAKSVEKVKREGGVQLKMPIAI